MRSSVDVCIVSAAAAAKRAGWPYSRLMYLFISSRLSNIIIE